jgi:glycosyltransferase involved in cell wall biosynthesis
MASNPLVSVVIPVLNGERHIRSCIDSVLEQTYENFEIVIADNASTDRTLEIVNSYDDIRIRKLLTPREQLGIHANWGRSVSAARGEFIKILCHDDLLLPNCLLIQTQLFREYPKALLVSNRRQIIDDSGQVLIRSRGLGRLCGPTGTSLINGDEIAKACVKAGTNLLGEPASVLIRRSAFPEAILDTDWRFAMDIDLYLRCLQNQPAIVNERAVAAFRVSPNQMSADLSKSQTAEMRDFFRHLRFRYPDTVTRRDIRVGVTKATAFTQLRRLIYGQLRLRQIVISRRKVR